MATDLKTQMLERLIDAGSWMRRADLVAGLSSSPLAQEDALADLVIEGKAAYSSQGYQLAGGVMAKRAAWLLRRKNTARAVYGEEVKGEYRVGVAEMRQMGARNELSLVIYELAMPMPAPGPDALEKHLRQVRGVMDLSMTNVTQSLVNGA
jgi:hypothetical protein